MLRLRAVRKLEKAGEHPSVLLGVRENRLLEVDSVRQEDVVLVHSETQMAGTARGEAEGRFLSRRSPPSYFSLAQQVPLKSHRLLAGMWPSALLALSCRDGNFHHGGLDQAAAGGT